MSRRARQRRRRHNQAGASRVLFVGFGALASMAVAGLVAGAVYVLAVAQSEPSLASLKAIVPGASSELFAADGTRLGFIQSDSLRSPISASQMPAALRDATVAIEDQRFYQNDGVDLTGIFRSAVKDALHGQALQGASTITMQLVRNLYLGSDTHTLRQKIDEAKLALEYNKAHSKQEILTEYLNSVPYGTLEGQTAIGVQAAARIFFDENVSDLDLQQSALLAGLPQAPSEYNPFLYPQAARQRRDEVLGKMAELHYITSSQAAAAEAAPLEVKHGDYYSQRQQSFFFEYVRQQLIKRYGLHTVEQGGLKVYTTLDLHMQDLARKAIAEVLDEPEDPAAAIVTIDPRTGDVDAMAESESYDQSQYNLASEGHRQPGSTFKAIDLAEALTRGIDPYSTYYISHTLAPGWLEGYPTYEVKTFENTSLNKAIDLVQATLTSDNTVYAQLAADLGEETITQMAYKMGVKEHLDSDPAEALGGLTVGVSPLEMADVYATLADGGLRDEPIAITKVSFPDGHVDSSWGAPHRVRALSEAVASVETSILEQNVQSGTAVRSAISCPTAAKTGTTSELVDAWLDGYTPDYSTSVWMGYPNKDVPMTDVHGEPQQGGALPAQIWHDYMAAVTEGRPCVDFPTPSEQIKYQAFYGKFATMGAAGPKESEEEIQAKKKQSKHPKKAASVPIEVTETPGGEPSEHAHHGGEAERGATGERGGGEHATGGEDHGEPQAHTPHAPAGEPAAPAEHAAPQGPGPTVGASGGAEPPGQ